MGFWKEEEVIWEGRDLWREVVRVRVRVGE